MIIIQKKQNKFRKDEKKLFSDSFWFIDVGGYVLVEALL